MSRGGNSWLVAYSSWEHGARVTAEGVEHAEKNHGIREGGWFTAENAENTEGCDR